MDIIPADVVIMGASKKLDTLRLAPELRESIARAIHEEYRRVRADSAKSHDPTMSEWDKLPDYLKESNLQQADDIIVKLCRIGCTARRVVNCHINGITFTADEVEAMAQMEHARWNVERLLDGWRWGKKRDVLKKTSPYLVGWSDLPDEAKEQDRQVVRGIPRFLATVGLEVLRKRKR